MSDNSFIPFCELKEFPNGHNKKKNSSAEKVIKNSKVRKSGQRVIANHQQKKNHEIKCSPVVEDGIVVAIEVACECGGATTISLEYGE